MYNLMYSMKIIRKGSCKKRGLCCKSIHVELKTRWIKNVKFWLFILKFSPLRHLTYTELDEDGDMRFKCRHLTKQGQCGIHTTRPMFCRLYPFQSTYRNNKMLPGCGYWFEKQLE